MESNEAEQKIEIRIMQNGINLGYSVTIKRNNISIRGVSEEEERGKKSGHKIYLKK